MFLMQTNAVRLHTLFQFIDGYRAHHNLRGFLHLGYDYAVFLRLPKPHDRFLVYELYEAKKVANMNEGATPRVIAISKVPIEYIKEQLKIFRQELYKAMYVDENVVPGTQVKTLREWQIERALSFNDDEGAVLNDQPSILRTIF